MTNKMTVREAIVAISKKHAGIVTTRDMQDLGFGPSALREYAHRHPPVTKYGRGIYCFDDIVEEFDIDNSDMGWFIDMAEAGKGSYLAGSTVLNFYDLGMLMPRKAYLRTPSKHLLSKTSPVVLGKADPSDEIDVIRGVRLQRLSQAFMLARDVETPQRLRAAADKAMDMNLLTGEENYRINKAIDHDLIRLPEVGRVA